MVWLNVQWPIRLADVDTFYLELGFTYACRTISRKWQWLAMGIERTAQNANHSERKGIMYISRRVLVWKALLLMTLVLVTVRAGAAQASAFATLYNFKGDIDGASPNGVTLGKNGVLYGTTYAGGSNNTCNGNLCGTVFELAPVKGAAWTKTVLFDFNWADGAWPSPSPIGAPGPSLLFGANGALFGTTAAGGTSAATSFGGTVFELAPPSIAGGVWTESVLYNLGGSADRPNTPLGGLFVGPSGAIYGTAENSFFFGGGDGGGSETGGAVFALTPPAASGGSWTQRILFDFYPITALGLQPLSALVSFDGSLYGTTYLQGAGGGCGVVYELAPPATRGAAWTGTAIYTLGGDAGCYSVAPLTPGPGGVLYGTTLGGGIGTCLFGESFGCGTVFHLTPPGTAGGTWTESVIYSFTALNGDGAFPVAGVVLGKDGVLYGTTTNGGSAVSGSPCIGYGAGQVYGPIGCGTVFELTPAAAPGGGWTETILYSFTGENGEGSIPGPLTMNQDGVLFGPTWTGGTAGKGTIFALAP
jgi:uncharacterized repeat protein (TIGR03803 family)